MLFPLFYFIAAGTITCQIDTPDRDECIKEAIQDMLPKLVVRAKIILTH